MNAADVTEAVPAKERVYMSAKSILEEGAETINNTAAESTGSIVRWFENLGTNALTYLVRIAFAVLIFFVIWKILKKFCAWLEKRMTKKDVDPSVKSFVISVVKWGTMIFVVVEIIVQLNIVAASSIAAIIASAGVGISLAAQGTLSNFAGGILLLALRPFRTGDYIMIPAVSAEGTVRKIEMYYTTIETAYHELILIPNSSLTNNQVTNLTALGKRKLEVKVGISYSADIRKAREVLEGLILRDARIENEGHQVFVDELADSSVVMALRCFVKTDDYYPVKWDLNESIKEAFDREGIEIPFGQLDVHVKNDGDPDIK